MFVSLSKVEMAYPQNPSDSEQSSLSDQSGSSRSCNRSLRIAEKKRRKDTAEDPFFLALKYFSDGRTPMRDMLALMLPISKRA